ncbi:Clp protease N-terminal domain-containing protein [Kibdelosporangium aridum]|uniref:Clp protease N-terminal domain-containing protein n=1 Tax=Kibdelosporangium aridum TaxID=2030 RepID=UPI000524205A
MPSTFDKYLHRIIEQAGREAQDNRSATIEAQHLLLAIAQDQEPSTKKLLATAGLDHPRLREALDREFEHSLNTVGVSKKNFDLTSYQPDPPTTVGASFKAALERSFTTNRKKDLRPAHVLLGVLQAEHGTVPRALELAGVNQQALVSRIDEALT